MKFKQTAMVLFLSLSVLSLVSAQQITKSLAPVEGVTQYIYQYNYSLSSINISYDYRAATLKGVVVGDNLKPNFNYQMKLEGKPGCIYGDNGNNDSNKKIGYIGRWWDHDHCTTSCNIATDSYVESHPDYCITGYALFDFLTTDENGDVVRYFSLNFSSHVLWCSAPEGGNNNNYLVGGSCPAENLWAEPERGNVNMSSGNYTIKFLLTEESFHDYSTGAWPTVLTADNISFNILPTPPIFSNAANISDTFQKYHNFTANIAITGTNLSHYTFSTNNFGSWQNDSAMAMYGIEYNASTSKNISLGRGNYICWMYYANDSLGKINNSDSYCFSVANTAPVLSIIPSIIANETTLINITANATDLDNNSLTYHINDTRFNRADNVFTWQTNITNSGVYVVSINVTDDSAVDSRNVTITIIDAPDLDSDGNPDFNDTDDDNDGINDGDDRLTGNAISVGIYNLNSTLNITVNGTTNLSQMFNETLNISFKDGNIMLVEFEFNFSNTLALQNITINKQEAGVAAGSILVKGINLPTGQTKTVYVDKLQADVVICVKDAEIASVSEIQQNCSGANETRLTCPASGNPATKKGYSCTNLGDRFKVEGLEHSGVLQINCTDSDGDDYGDGCANGDDCNDNDNSKAIDCNSGSSSSGGGGGSSGGGGGTFILRLSCEENWQCLSWSACDPAGVQTRNCKDIANCGSIKNKPVTSQKCTYAAPSSEKEEKKELEGEEGGLGLVTGAVVGAKERSTIVGPVIPILSLVGGLFGYFLFKKRNL